MVSLAITCRPSILRPPRPAPDGGQFGKPDRLWGMRGCCVAAGEQDESALDGSFAVQAEIPGDANYLTFGFDPL